MGALDTFPSRKCFGAAMSASPWERLWNGDEDVAFPFLAGAVSSCADEEWEANKRLAICESNAILPNMWFKRTYEDILQHPTEALRLFPVWLFLGPRQVGKSI